LEGVDRFLALQAIPKYLRFEQGDLEDDENEDDDTITGPIERIVTNGN